MSVASLLPRFLLLGFVLLATVLLMAGYGAAVGIGILAGLVLGWAVVAALMAMAPRSGSSVSFLTRSRRGGEPDQTAMAVIEGHARDSMRVAGVDAGVLRRVIPLGDAVEAGGVRVELVALEIRDDGAIATLVSHTRPPVGNTGHFVEATVSDDAGTAYVAAGQGTGGSGLGTGRYEIRLAPAPLAGAVTLILRVEAFLDPFPGPAVELRGPWEFRIAL
ncbi:MAG: hypothetical protein ABSE70_03415 [Candidatus Limnocylindrales bacterium]